MSPEITKTHINITRCGLCPFEQILNVHPAKMNRYCKFYQEEFRTDSLIKDKKDKPAFCKVKKIVVHEKEVT